MTFRSRSGRTRRQLRQRTGLHVPDFSSRVPDGVTNPCRLVLTAARGTNGKLLRVRCECMAQVVLVEAVRPYTNYDVIGETRGGLEAALELWRAHQAEQRRQSA